MLARLHIQNFALIEEMDVSFPGGLTVLTGETGAGKSIFLEALGLALGRRADADLVREGAKKCVVEAEFIVNGSVDDILAASELETDNRLLLRREVSAEGKSRAFVNDGLVGLNVLKDLAERLVDIHSQHQTLLLGKSDFQLQLLDAFAGNAKDLLDYGTCYKELRVLNETIEELKQREAEGRREAEFLAFQVAEIDALELKPGDVRALEEECSLLENASSIRERLEAATMWLSGTEDSVLSQLSKARQQLQSISNYSTTYAELGSRLNGCYVELKDIENETQRESGRVDLDPARLQVVTEALDKVNSLCRKHNVAGGDELLALRETLAAKLNAFQSAGAKLEELAKKKIAAQKTVLEKAALLSAQRLQVVDTLEKSVTKLLHELSMPNAIFKIQMTALPEPGPNGMNRVTFLFSANKGIATSELSKVASGGELSRLMLTLKALLAERKELPTIIFDEIDTGVSGDVADRIGGILLKMGKTMQVIAITHLPQMASKGHHHLFVYKHHEGKSTASMIKELKNEERVQEIAKMLSTSNPTDSAVRNARELLSF